MNGRRGEARAVRVVASVVGLALAVAALWQSPPAAGATAKNLPAGGEERIKRLVKDLGDDSYKVRQRAQEQLIEIGSPAIELLEQAKSSPDPEVRQRAGKALEEIRKGALGRASAAMRKNLLWEVAVPSGLAGPPVLGGKAVLFLSRTGSLRAVDAGTGKALWQFAAAVRGGVLVSHQAVYVRDDQGRLRALDLTTGKPAPVSGLDDMAGLPAVTDGVIFTAGGGKTFLAVDARSGNRRWEAELPSEAAKRIRPVPAGDAVCVATDDGAVHALDARTGRKKWTASVAKGEVRSLGLHEGLVILTSRTGLHAVDLRTGKAAWQQAVPISNAQAGQARARVVQQVVVNGRRVVLTSDEDEGADPVAGCDGTVYVVDGDGLVAVDAKTGRKRWTHELELTGQGGPEGVNSVIVQGGGQVRIQVMGQVLLGGGTTGRRGLSPPAIAGGKVLLGSREGLHAIDSKTRREIWRFKTPNPVSGSPVVADGVVYFGTAPRSLTVVGAAGAADGSVLYALRLKVED